MNVLFLSRSHNSRPHAFVEEQAAALERSFDVHIIHHLIQKGGIRGYISTIGSLANIVNEKQIDIVHVHYGLWGMIAVISKMIFFQKHKILITYHGSDIFKGNERRISLMAARFADFNILVSEKMTPWFSKKHTVIPCGIDTDIEQFDRITTRNSKGWGSDDFIILFSSAFSRAVKDPGFAFEVVRKLQQTCNKPVRLIELKGFYRNELTAIMQSADALIMCSNSEGSPQVIKEAILNRLPVVSNDVGEVSKICQGTDQCFILPKEINAFVKVLQNLSVTNDRISNREKVLQEYDNSRIANHIFSIYRQVNSTAVLMPR